MLPIEKYTSPVPKDVRLTGKWAHTLRAGATGACLRFSGFAAARIGVQEGIISAGGKEGRRMVDNEDWVTVGVVSPPFRASMRRKEGRLRERERS
jgi:hypothetical protein